MYDTKTLKLLESNSKLLPSIVQAPTLELKTLPKHLEYVYLGEKINAFSHHIKQAVRENRNQADYNFEAVQKHDWVDYS